LKSLKDKKGTMSLIEEKKRLVDRGRLPRHVAIIMDGNGRWAERQNLHRIEGHRKGLEAVKEVVEISKELGIEVLTLYAFSKENWQRPKEEVDQLMELLHDYLLSERDRLLEEGIRLNPIGDLDDLPPRVREALLETARMTSENRDLILNLALSYSGRWEILKGVKRAIEEVREGRLRLQDLTPEVFSGFLSTAGLPDPDLLIRTSGEQRISNFLLWQVAYTELYFTEVLWPEFTKADFLDAILDYQSRERRFGLTSSQLTGNPSGGARS